jgi:hypothetical protein
MEVLSYVSIGEDRNGLPSLEGLNYGCIKKKMGVVALFGFELI